MQLLDFSPGDVRIVREISAAEYDVYHAAARHLRDFGRWRSLVRMVGNREQFSKSLNQAAALAQSEATCWYEVPPS